MAETTLFPPTQRPAPGIDPVRWPDIDALPPRTWRTRIAKTVVRRAVRDLPLRIELSQNEVWGSASVGAPTIVVSNPDAFFRRVGRSGMIGFGESYMAGEWDTADAETLTAAMTVLAANVSALIPAGLQRLRRFALQTMPIESRDWRRASKENIAAHYDLSNDLFAAFLDPTMTYSSAIFENAASADWLDLPIAQRAKIDRLLDNAGVRRGTRLLEIGTGWGELAIRAAQRGALVTTLTLSEQQASLAARRVQEAGLADVVDIRLQDYRDAANQNDAGQYDTGQYDAVQYDAIVSVEMIEAIGYHQWPTYFTTLERLLAPGGKIAIQAITMPHDRLEATRNTYGWIHKYIFPGGLLPSVEAIENTVADYTDLHICDHLSFGDHYAATLRLWLEQFDANWDRLRSLGFDDTFRRMWRFYLCYTRAGFEAGYLNVRQFVLRSTP